MPIHIEHADLPFSQQQVFDLVADIERYPAFLPQVASARIRRKVGNTLWVDQVVQFKMLRMHFSTRAVLDRPSSIHVVCSDSLFGKFIDDWQFTSNASGGTRLQCTADYQFRSGLLRVVLEPALSDVLSATVRAFTVRAGKLYGQAMASS